MGTPWPPPARRAPACLPTIAKAVSRFFDGITDALDELELPLPPGPPFYQSCWAACRRIPAGSTVTYAELAAMAGQPRAARAAGSAMRANPIPILVPCHRIVASGGGTGGFAGCTTPGSTALQLKHRLIAFEQSHTDSARTMGKEHRSCA